MDRGRYLGQVQQHLWEEGVHGARHLQDAGYQSHNTDLKPAMIVWLDIPDKVTTNLITLIVKTIFNDLLAEAYNLVTSQTPGCSYYSKVNFSS